MKKIKITLIILVLIVLSAILIYQNPKVKNFLSVKVGKCVDRGGSWNYNVEKCDFEKTQASPWSENSNVFEEKKLNKSVTEEFSDNASFTDLKEEKDFSELVSVLNEDTFKDLYESKVIRGFIPFKPDSLYIKLEDNFYDVFFERRIFQFAYC